MKQTRSIFAACLLLAVLAVLPVRAASLPAACAASIRFTHVPPLNSTQNLSGRVDCLDAATHAVVVYIQVNGGWWIKPTTVAPITAIQPDGSWTADITTGGLDASASDIAAFAIPKSYAPPMLLNSPAIPDALFQSAAAFTSTRRSAPRTIEFAGDTWEVRSDPLLSGPGPNFFSDSTDNVWVDAQGALHLRIQYRNGHWWCAEVINTNPAGYGKHQLWIDSPVDLLDPNDVLGFFTWDTFAPQYNYREIDIEFARWGDPYAPNAQYVIQPYTTPGNLYRYHLSIPTQRSLHIFDWQPGQVNFWSYDQNDSLLQQWSYTNQPAVPPAGGHIHLNLWLMSGLAPTNSGPQEVVIHDYQFTPLPLNNHLYLPGVQSGK